MGGKVREEESFSWGPEAGLEHMQTWDSSTSNEDKQPDAIIAALLQCSRGCSEKSQQKQHTEAFKAEEL